MDAPAKELVFDQPHGDTMNVSDWGELSNRGFALVANGVHNIEKYKDDHDALVILEQAMMQRWEELGVPIVLLPFLKGWFRRIDEARARLVN